MNMKLIKKKKKKKTIYIDIYKNNLFIFQTTCIHIYITI